MPVCVPVCAYVCACVPVCLCVPVCACVCVLYLVRCDLYVWFLYSGKGLTA